ncbi:DUF3116 family protein [Paenilisteria rocourtiae]|uniref:Uncharacterized protein DUF3116 n=1 Tax=Listeria rocourtiae TaxID=647910 RepID=A0A4R6ZMI2_9LIST|nr:hypothetical protein PROCOU_01719 [Listeria rocourtiae FSL F6-920]MBC1434291.1 DUF3116 family protein [Listeria rocourtiae]MBC1603814.1 DUF3116 family protein [Listeria rocourtiae]TDR53681.1 uncharacterized protein DUF3116 [Listeria rocourtiae]
MLDPSREAIKETLHLIMYEEDFTILKLQHREFLENSKSLNKNTLMRTIYWLEMHGHVKRGPLRFANKKLYHATPQGEVFYRSIMKES